MRFAPVLDLNLSHSYYTNGGCSDILIEPTQRTRRLLANHRCVLKSAPGRARVLIAAAGNDVVVPLPAQSTFVFQLIVRNSEWELFTDLTKFQDKPVPLYTNSGPPSGDINELVLVSRTTWRQEAFVVNQPHAAEAFTLRGLPLADDLGPNRFEVEGLEPVMHADGYDAVGKVVTVDTRSASKGHPFQIRYPVKPRRDQNVFAEAEIRLDQPVLTAAERPLGFQISLKAKQARWVYYVVSDGNGNGGEFQIVDQSTSETPINFSERRQRDLGRNPDPNDAVDELLRDQYPSTQRFRFASDELVPCRQAVRKQVELRIGENRISAGLPNPSPRNICKFASEDGGEQELALYHIVKCLTRSYPSMGA